MAVPPGGAVAGRGVGEGELTPRDLRTYRVLLGVGAGTILLLGFLYRLVDPGIVDPWSERLAVVGVVGAAFLLSYSVHPPVFLRVLYFAGYVVTAWIVRLLAVNDFHYQFALGLMVAVPAVSMIFRTRRQLFLYCGATIVLAGGAAALTPTAAISLATFLTYLVTLCVVCLVMLSARLQAAEELVLSEDRLRHLLESVADHGIFMLDPEGRVVSWNEGARRIHGYEEGEILGRSFAELHPEEARAAGIPAHHLEAARAGATVEEEGSRLRADGERFWASVTVTPLRRREERPSGFAVVTRDLTERHEAEERARRLAEVEAANRTKSEFLAALSHELRTPLNAIHGYVSLLLEGVQGPLREEQRASLERVGASQRHLLALIEELLQFSRLRGGGVTYERIPVPLSGSVGAVRPLIEPQARESGLRLEWPAGKGAVAIADPTKVQQILLNLLTNAVKFTPEGGCVRVALEEALDTVSLSVSDTGIGISSESLDQIFDPFVQLGRSSSSPHEGTGLGLAISRELARGMGGELGVRSVPGKGSTFTLELPRAGGGGVSPGLPGQPLTTAPPRFPR